VPSAYRRRRSGSQNAVHVEKSNTKDLENFLNLCLLTESLIKLVTLPDSVTRFDFYMVHKGGLVLVSLDSGVGGKKTLLSTKTCEKCRHNVQRNLNFNWASMPMAICVIPATQEADTRRIAV
jgi:hypothetical protein